MDRLSEVTGYIDPLLTPAPFYVEGAGAGVPPISPGFN